MAIFTCNVKSLSRRSGRSSVAAAAYRAGADLTDERTGERHNYSRRRGVTHTELLLPADAPAALRDRGALWSAAEKAERRKDARTAREYMIALPEELDALERHVLAVNFARYLTECYQVAADVAIHAPDKHGDQRNFHAHILTTTRRVGPQGLGAKADIELSRKQLNERGLPDVREQYKAIRQTWQEYANTALEDAGQSARIDCRPVAVRRLEAIASGNEEEIARWNRLRGFHLGPVQAAKRKHERAAAEAARDYQQDAAERARARAAAIYDDRARRWNEELRQATLHAIQQARELKARELTREEHKEEPEDESGMGGPS